jgi:hypothetical protein
MSTMPMEQSPYGLPDEVYRTRAERKRKLAEALKKDSIMPQGQMISGHYVAPSITQYLASGLKGYQANQLDRQADKEYDEGVLQNQKRRTDAQQKYLEALRPQSVQTGEQKQPFEANQMDRFGTPMQGQQQATTPIMGQRQPTPDEMYAAQMQFATDLQDPQAMMQAANSRIGRAEKMEDRGYNEQREDKVYTRNRGDQVADREDTQEFQRIAMKEQQGFQLTQQERQFAQAWKMQQSSQGFQAGQNNLSRQNAIEAANIKATTTAAKKTPLSSAAQKELFDAVDAAQGSKEAIKAFDKALSINKKAMGGIGAGALATAGTLLPKGIRPDTVDATKELDNVLQSSALPQLKAIFGGMPTEGERAILLEVQGSSSQPASVREGIFKRAIDAANNRIKYNEKKAQQLRDGSYFSEQGTAPQAPNVRTVDW